MVMHIYLNGLCAAGVKRFSDIFTSFYARQWYDVTKDVTRASLTVEDRLLIQELIRRWDSEHELLRSASHKLPEFAEIMQNNVHYADQGHSRSPILVPIKSSYTISY